MMLVMVARDRGSRRWRRRVQPVGVWVAGVLAAVLTAIVLAWLGGLGLVPGVGGDERATEDSDSPPFTVAVGDPTIACGNTSWLVNAAPRTFAEPPNQYDAGWARWAANASAVPVGETAVKITIQGRSNTQVTLTDLRVRVVERKPATNVSTWVTAPCGGTGAYRFLHADLDADPPAVTGVIDDTGSSAPDERRDPIRFPYRVSLSDAETFLVEGAAQTCYCRWELELSWAAQGRTGVTRIDHNGRPFVTIGRRHAAFACVRTDDLPLDCHRTT
jgi:hypothetical protein